MSATGRRPRVGLVLGGGGLTGTAFHAGVITALADVAGWDARTAEVVVGTSAGSTAAALMRAGFPPADYVARMTGEPLSDEGRRVLDGLGPLGQPGRRPPWARRPAAPDLLRRMARRPWDYRLGVVAAAALPEGTLPIDAGAARLAPLFDGWPDRSTWITAVRLSDGARVVFGRDGTASMADAVAASCAVPGYFEPVVIAGERFVDGGAYSVHSLDLLSQLGLDVVVVSAPLSTTDLVATDPGNLLRVPVRLRLDREAATVRRSGTRVVVVQPDAALRAVMGTNSMVLAKRGPVARAVHAHVAARLRDRPVDGLVA